MRLALRLAGLLRLEDLLLALLTAVGLPLLERWLRGTVVDASPTGNPSALIGIVGLLAVAGVIACVLTRGPDEPPLFRDRSLTLQGWARFPLAAGVGIVALETVPGLGFDPEPLAGLTFLAVFAGALLHPRLPVVPVTARRVLVLPMVVLAAAAFDRIIGRDLGPMALDLLGGEQPEVASFWPLLVGAVAMLYTMLVVAPRAIADPGSSGVAWTVRFLFFLGIVLLAAFLGIR
ncbi:MAG TPA: hypothetical protein VES19_07425 [Candidatus Limnocylindrales bacterium]|nr:hypothetical protein [Candidatus Limnocylindrales bacterium]